MELWEFENYVLDWCSKNKYLLRETIYNNKTNAVEIHRYHTIVGDYGLKKDIHECYHCYLNKDMTFKNVPHGMKSKINGKKLII